MSDSADYLARRLQQFGGSVQNLTGSLFKVDARNKFETESLAVAQAIEDFNEGLMNDPNFGTPSIITNPETGEVGPRDGYLEKWDEFKKTIDERIQAVANPEAKRELERYWGQAALDQEAKLETRQFEAWAANTEAETGKRVLDRIETGAYTPQEQLDMAVEDLQYLRDNNIIDTARYEERMALYSQAIIQKNLENEARAVYEKEGLTEALRYIDGADETYSAGGGMYHAGDQVKDMVKASVGEFHEIIQTEENSRMEKAYANMYLAFEGKKPEGPTLSAAMIQGSKLDFDSQMYWLDRLDGMNRGAQGSATVKNHAGLMMNWITYLANKLRASGGTINGGATITIGTDLNGKPIKVPGTWDGLEALIGENIGIIMQNEGASAAASLAEFQGWRGDTSVGVLPDVDRMIDGIKDLGQQAKTRAWYMSMMKNYPNMAPRDVVAAVQAVIDQDVVTPRLHSRFLSGAQTKKGDDEGLTYGFWDNEYSYHFTMNPDDGMPLPTNPNTEEAMRAFMTAQTIEVGALTGLYSGPDNVPDNVQTIAAQKDQFGNTEVVTIVWNKDGTSTEYRRVPFVDSAGKRKEATMLRTTLSGNRGERKETLEIYDPATKKWVAVTNSDRQDTGWGIPKTIIQAREENKARINEFEVQVLDARSEYERVARDYGQGATTIEQVQAAQARLDALEKQLRDMKAAPLATTPSATTAPAKAPTSARNLMP